jgi:5-methylcytosine-specific restriction endonuclease McrA
MKSIRRSRQSVKLRKKIKAKTAGRCHVCGGPLRDKWTADHVRPRARGGADKENNYLPCCGICNDARWHRPSRTIRKMLRLGVYLLPEIKKKTALGRAAMALFYSRRAVNKSRRRKARRARA